MIIIGILLFIIIVGTSTMINRRKRYVAELELTGIREKNKNAIQELHETTKISLQR